MIAESLDVSSVVEPIAKNLAVKLLFPNKYFSKEPS